MALTKARRTFLAQAAAVPFVAIAPEVLSSTPGNLIVLNERLWLDVRVNGHPVQALLDSAAETSVIDARFAMRIGLVGGSTVRARGSGGDTEAQLAVGVTIDVLDVRLHPEAVAVLDLSDVGARLLHGPLYIILGRELFDQGRMSIDIARGRIAFVTSKTAPSGWELDLTSEKGLETFPASVEGHAAVGAAFDLGNGGAVLVGADYANEVGLLTDGRPVSMVSGGGIGGAKPRQTLTLRSLTFAGRTFTDLPATIDANSSATKLNIGVQVLRHFQIVTDFPIHKLWLASGPARIS